MVANYKTEIRVPITKAGEWANAERNNAGGGTVCKPAHQRTRKEETTNKEKKAINNQENKETKRNGNGEKEKGRQDGMCVFFRKVKGKAGGGVCCSQ